MSMIKKSITITDQQNDWIQAQMASGNYGTDSEVIREALREKQSRSEEVERIRFLLQEAGQSGSVKYSSKEDVLKAVKKRVKKRG